MTDDSRASIRPHCQRYAQKYGHKENDLAKGLEAYAAHVFAQEDGFDIVLEGKKTDDVDLSDYILRSHDLGVDVVLEDEARKRLLLVQAAWRGKGKRLEEAKINDFAGVVARLKDPDYVAKGGNQARDLLGAVGQKLDDGYSVELRLVTNLRMGHDDRLAAAVSAHNDAFEETDSAVKLEVFGETELLRRHAELQSATLGAAVESVEFKLQSMRYMKFDAPSMAPRKTLVGVIKGAELAALYGRKDVGNKLFNLNIRLPLTTKKVNPELTKTATEQGADFFYFNNGVSAVASSFEVTDGVVKAKRFQVINGAQTVSALHKAFKLNGIPEVYVLFRLTETNEQYGSQQFTDSIIRFNNTQNPVKVSDFFSNDPIQVWLSEHLTAKSGHGPMPAFYYVHKSGFRKHGNRKQLKIDTFAGVRHSFLYGPVTSYKEPAQFFDKSQKYYEAFGVNGARADHWDDETLAEACVAIAVVDRVQTLGTELKKRPDAKDLPEARYLFRLARYVGALAGEGLRSIKDTHFLEYKTLLASKPAFDKYVDPILDKARDLVEIRMGNLKDTAVQPEYNFARDQVDWESLSSSIRSAALTRLKF